MVRSEKQLDWETTDLKRYCCVSLLFMSLLQFMYSPTEQGRRTSKRPLRGFRISKTVDLRVKQ